MIPGERPALATAVSIVGRLHQPPNAIRREDQQPDRQGGGHQLGDGHGISRHIEAGIPDARKLIFLVGPCAGKIIIPVAGIQGVIAVKCDHEPQVTVIDETAARLFDSVPVKTLQIYVGAGRYTPHARAHVGCIPHGPAAHGLRDGLLGLMSLAFQNAPWFGIDLLYRGNRADKGAPGLAAEKIAGRNRGANESQKKDGQGHSVGVDEQDPGHDTKRKDAELKEPMIPVEEGSWPHNYGFLFHVSGIGIDRPSDPLYPQHPWNLREEGKRTDAPPGLMAEHHEEQGNDGNDHGPEDARRHRVWPLDDAPALNPQAAIIANASLVLAPIDPFLTGLRIDDI